MLKQTISAVKMPNQEQIAEDKMAKPKRATELLIEKKLADLKSETQERWNNLVFETDKILHEWQSVHVIAAWCELRQSEQMLEEGDEFLIQHLENYAKLRFDYDRDYLESFLD